MTIVGLAGNLRKIFIAAFSLATLSLITPLPGYAGAPFITDDPGTVGEGHFEFFLAGAGARSDGDHSGLAQLEFNYGPSDNLDLHFLVGSKEGAVIGRMFNFGSGGIEIGSKYRFVEETEKQPSLAIFPVLQIPVTDDHDEARDNATVFIPLWAQKNWGPWNSFLGGGYALTAGEDEENWGIAGWGLKRIFYDTFDLGAELFYAQAGDEGGKDAFGTNVGGTVKLNEHYNFLASVGSDFKGDADLRYYVAIQGVY